MINLSHSSKSRARFSRALPMSLVWVLLMVLCGCSREDDFVNPPVNGGSGEPILLSIGNPVVLPYNSDASSTRSAVSGIPRAAELSEWCGISSPLMMRSVHDPDYEGPRIALMEIVQDSLSTDSARSQTRAAMGSNIQFRVMVFIKNGSNYTFSSAADYQVSGSGVPVLANGSKALVGGEDGQIVRIVAYSENSTTLSTVLASSYAWNSAVSISRLDRDFMTYDSSDIVAKGPNQPISVTFKQMLCKMSVSCTASGFTNNTVSGISGAYISGVGTVGTWNIGSSGVAASNTGNVSLSFSGASSSNNRMFPASSGSKVSVYFGSFKTDQTFSGKTVTSSNSLTRVGGKTYSMTITFKKKVGINVPEGDINLGSGCSAADKAALSKIKWASGNLASAGNSNYVCAGPTAYGYYYQFNKLYDGTAGDPCSKLNASTYGTGWVSPSRTTMEQLSRCTDNVLTGGVMWFLNKTSGLCLPAAGYRDSSSGSTADYDAGNDGLYWSSTPNGSGGDFLYFTSGGSSVGYGTNSGYSVRCAQ